MMNAGAVGGCVALLCAGVQGVPAAQDGKKDVVETALAGPVVWRAEMVQAMPGWELRSTVFISGTKMRIEGHKGARRDVKLYDGRVRYDFLEGAKTAMAVRKAPFPVWRPFYSDRSTFTVKGAETLCGKPCEIRQAPGSAEGTLIEWVWKEGGLALRREQRNQDRLTTMALEQLEVGADLSDDHLWRLPAGMAVVRPPANVAEADLLGTVIAPCTLKVAGQAAMLTLSASWGSRATVINFFASWCGPCRQEMPDLVEAHQAYKDRGVAFLSVDVGEKAGKDPEEMALWFVKEYHVRWPVLMDEDFYGLPYALGGIPTSVIVDHQGVIRAFRCGAVNAQWLKDALDPLVAP